MNFEDIKIGDMVYYRLGSFEHLKAYRRRLGVIIDKEERTKQSCIHLFDPIEDMLGGDDMVIVWAYPEFIMVADAKE